MGTTLMATLIMSFLLIPCSHAHKESVCSHYTYTLKKKNIYWMAYLKFVIFYTYTVLGLQILHQKLCKFATNYSISV